jgi:hypothetical protein
MSTQLPPHIQPEQGAQTALHELNLSLHPQINYNYDSMFQKISGWGSKGDIKRIHGTVIPIEPLLAKMLFPEEQVLYVARGIQHKISEQYFLGIWANLINQTVFVLTNLRVLMFRVNSKGIPQNTNWMIYYNQIKKIKGSMLGAMVVKLQDGNSLTFTGFKGTDKKQIPLVFEDAVATYQQLGFQPESSQSRENVCSNCLQVVPKQHYECARCGQVFWKPSEVAMRSLIFPSWGDFCMGHVTLAGVELLGYLFTWIIFFGAIVQAIANPNLATAIGAILVFVFVLIFEHLVDAALTYFIAKKGLHPKGQPPTQNALPV